MNNSKSLPGRIAEYEKAGWTVNGIMATVETKRSVKHRAMAPDGEYDVWLPLPDDALASSTNNKKLSAVLALNARIEKGEIVNGMSCADCPSAWIDFSGNERNKMLFTAAEKAAIERIMRDNGQIYKRSGSRFVKL